MLKQDLKKADTSTVQMNIAVSHLGRIYDKEKEEFSLYWTCPERFKQNKVFTGNELMRCDIFSVGIVINVYTLTPANYMWTGCF